MLTKNRAQLKTDNLQIIISSNYYMCILYIKMFTMDLKALHQENAIRKSILKESPLEQAVFLLSNPRDLVGVVSSIVGDRRTIKMYLETIPCHGKLYSLQIGNYSW